jgi:hypothetical protein
MANPGRIWCTQEDFKYYQRNVLGLRMSDAL